MLPACPFSSTCVTPGIDVTHMPKGNPVYTFMYEVSMRNVAFKDSNHYHTYLFMVNCQKQVYLVTLNPKQVCSNTKYITHVTKGVLTIWETIARIIFVFTFYKKLKNVSCEYDRVNGWNSTLQAAWYIRYLHKLSFARVLCFILMKDIGRWLPWMLPGSTGRFSITILCTDTI